MTAVRRLGLLAPLVAISLAGCGLNSVPAAEERVNAAWGNLQSEYQRRNDLIPNLVSTVKAAAAQEMSVLVEVTNARANANRIQLSPADLDDPARVRQFNEAQNQISLSLQRLQEAYPELRTNQNFLTLQSQIEGTENSILVGRRDYNEAVQAYNTTIRTFPDAIGAKIIHGAKPKVPFEAAAGSQNAPSVDFGNAS